MNSVESNVTDNRMYQARPDWFELAFPAPAVPLVLLLVIIFPLFVLTAESLLAPVAEFVQSLLLPINAGVDYTHLPLLLLLKIGLFSLFTFTGVGLLLLKISCIYHEVWSQFLQQPHRNHAYYHPDQTESMVALFNWTLFRWFRVLGPFMAWMALTVVVGATLFWIFSSFTGFGFFSFHLQVTLSMFIMLTLGLFTALALLQGLRIGFTTILGDVAAITEPEKPTQTLFDRARLLAFASPWVLVLYPAYFLFYLLLLIEMIYLVVRFDVADITGFNPDIAMIYAGAAVTFVIFLMLSGFKFFAYHDALARFYQRQG